MSLEPNLSSEGWGKTIITRSSQSSNTEIDKNPLSTVFTEKKKVMKSKCFSSDNSYPTKRAKPNQDPENFGDSILQGIPQKTKRPSLKLFKKSNYVNESIIEKNEENSKDENLNKILKPKIKKIFKKTLDPADPIKWESFYKDKMFFHLKDKRYLENKVDDGGKSEKNEENVIKFHKNETNSQINTKLTKTIEFFCDPKYNQPQFYDIVGSSRFVKFQSIFGDHYIGPANFIHLRNKSNSKNIHFSILIDQHNFNQKKYKLPYNFPLNEIIIPCAP